MPKHEVSTNEVSETSPTAITELKLDDVAGGGQHDMPKPNPWTMVTYVDPYTGHTMGLPTMAWSK
jgi:hypothetical protein